MANIAEVLGEDFASKYKTSRRKIVVPDKSDIWNIKKLIKDNKFNAANASMIYEHDGKRFDVLLVETADDLRSKPTTSGNSVRMSSKWKGNWMTLFVPNPETHKVIPNMAFFVVGGFKLGEWQGKPQYTMFVNEIITLDEIAAFEGQTTL